MAKRIRQAEHEYHAPEHQATARPMEVEAAPQVPAGKYLVTFSPPSYVGPKAARMVVAANSATEALAIWRTETGFTGSLAVAPVVVEVTGEEQAEAEG